MYHKQRQIKKLNSYIPAAEAFRVFSGEKDCVFLDSSLVNDLGRYSIIGAEPYLKLVRDGDSFLINGQEETQISFEDYLREYLRDHVDIFLMIMGVNYREFHPVKRISSKFRMRY